MATLREYLNSAGFDWESGRVMVHRHHDGAEYASYPGWMDFSEVGDRGFIDFDDEILDKEFEDGYGGPDCPRFVAEDKEKIYFPWQYDGATGIDWVYKDLGEYITKPTPYPGG